MTPPPLAWLPSYTESLSAALGQGVSSRVEDTINPLVKKVVFTFTGDISGNLKLTIWNLFQKYAWSNECVPQGKLVSTNPKRFAVEVIMRRRAGPQMTFKPWERERNGR